MRRPAPAEPALTSTLPPSSPLTQVVVLAAGHGRRLGAITRKRPKALVEVAGVTLLEHALRFARSLGAPETLVVAGYCADDVASRLAALDMPRVRLVRNARHAEGNLLSVDAALPHVRGTFLLTNCDHLFPHVAAAKVLSSVGSEVTAFCEFERELAADEMKVVVDAGRALVRISKTLPEFDGGYVGLTHVPAHRLPAYRSAVAAAFATHGSSAVAEHALQALADARELVATASLDGVPWYEVDTPEDLARARALAGSMSGPAGIPAQALAADD